jgi:hypothetical protein
MLYILMIIGFFLVIKMINTNNERLRERRNKDSKFSKRRFKR